MSNIVFDTIDESFPLAGQDNDSQGFRDNFSILKAGLATASSEITVLENSVLRFNDGTGGIVNNNLNGSGLFNGTISQMSATSNNQGQLTTTSTTVSFLDGLHHKFEINRNLTVNLQDWPTTTNVQSKMTIEIASAADATTYNIAVTSNGATIIRKNQPVIQTGLAPAAGQLNVIVFDVWTSDGGDTVYVDYRGEFVE